MGVAWCSLIDQVLIRSSAISLVNKGDFCCIRILGLTVTTSSWSGHVDEGNGSEASCEKVINLIRSHRNSSIRGLQ
jgi:hypothetical protein